MWCHTVDEHATLFNRAAEVGKMIYNRRPRLQCLYQCLTTDQNVLRLPCGKIGPYAFLDARKKNQRRPHMLRQKVCDGCVAYTGVRPRYTTPPLINHTCATTERRPGQAVRSVLGTQLERPRLLRWAADVPLREFRVHNVQALAAADTGNSKGPRPQLPLPIRPTYRVAPKASTYRFPFRPSTANHQCLLRLGGAC